MFDKFKQLKQLKNLKASMESEQMTVENKGVKVTVGGSMKVKEVQLNSDLSLEEQEDIVKQNINEAFKKMQKKIAKKMSQA